MTTFGTNDWVPTQWLPQVVMAQLEDWFGLAGVAWLSGLIYVSLALTIWVVARRHASPLVAAPVTVVAILAAADGMSMRPQVLSYLLVVVTTEAWLTTREDHKVRWWLVPLAWVWAMVHGMWPVGIIIGLVALVGIALDRAVRAPRVAPPGRHPPALDRGHRTDPGRAGPVLGGARGQLARSVLRGVAAAGLQGRRQHRAAHPRRRGARQPAAPRRRWSPGPTCCCCCWPGVGGSTPTAP